MRRIIHRFADEGCYREWLKEGVRDGSVETLTIFITKDDAAKMFPPRQNQSLVNVLFDVLSGSSQPGGERGEILTNGAASFLNLKLFFFFFFFFVFSSLFSLFKRNREGEAGGI